MHSNLIYNCGNLFKLSKKHLINPAGSMSAESLRENFGKCQAWSQFIAPISVTLGVASFFSSLLWNSECGLDSAVYNMMTSATSPIMIYYVVNMLSRKIFVKFEINEGIEEKAQVVTLQLMLLYFVVTFLCTILPGAKLMSCLYVYSFYMLWQMAGEYLEISDERRISFMLIEMALCAATILFISLVINFITSEHP